jgi:hypothetical protein
VGRQSGLQAGIGRKGLGFKSVFAVSDCPHVCSNGFSFRFDVATHGLFGALLPEWVDPEQIPPAEVVAKLRRQLGNGPRQAVLADAIDTAPPGTTLWLPLPGHKEAGLPALPLTPEMMLFLRQLTRIQIIALQHDGSQLVRRICRGGDGTAPDDTGDGFGTEAGWSSMLERVVLLEEIEEQSLPPAATDGEEGGDRQGVGAGGSGSVGEGEGMHQATLEYLLWHEDTEVCGRRTVLTLAFPAQRPSGPLPLCAWLPVASVGLPFVLHADWQLVASRQALRTDAVWNAGLRDAAVLALLRAVRSEPWLRRHVSAWLPRAELCADPFWKPLFEVAASLRTERLLVAEDQMPVAPQSALLRTMANNDRSAADAEDAGGTVSERLVPNAWVRDTLGLSFVSASVVSEIGVSTCEQLGCRRFTMELLLELLDAWSVSLVGTDVEADTPWVLPFSTRCACIGFDTFPHS